MSSIGTVSTSTSSIYITFTIPCTFDYSSNYRRAYVYCEGYYATSGAINDYSGSYTFSVRLGVSLFSTGYHTATIKIQYSTDGNTWLDSNLSTTTRFYIEGTTTTTTYYYRSYDLTNSIYLDSSSTSTTNSSITRNTWSGYTYTGYVYHRSFSECLSFGQQGMYDGTGITCSSHNSTYPYIVFFYIKDAYSSWQTPSYLYAITANSNTNWSSTSTIQGYASGYIRIYCPYDCTLTLKTTSNSTDPDYYSYLAYNTSATSPLSAGSGTTRGTAVDPLSSHYLTENDDGAGTGWDTQITYEATGGIYYFWYINAAFSSSNTYSCPWKITCSGITTGTLTFNANGGSGAPSSTTCFKINGSFQYDIPTICPTRSGYIFLGWDTVSTAIAPSIRANSFFYSASQSVTLYAVWQNINFTWSKYDLSEANTFTSYMNNYLSAGLSYPLPTNELIKASWYNTIANILGVTNTVTQGITKITKSDLDALATAYHNRYID